MKEHNQNIEKKTLFENIKYIFVFIAEAIKGVEHDFTKGSLKKAMFLLAIPMILEMVMESIFALVDIYFVSKISSEAVAVVGITESVITIVYAISIGLSMSTTAIIARRIGEKNYEAASLSAVQAMITGIIPAILISFVGIFFAEDLLVLMGASQEMASEYSGYPQVMLTGNIVIMLLFIINAVFRSAGDAAIAMRVLWMANLLNIVLDPCLIFGWGPFPELGITGAAVATNIGRGLAVIYQLYILFNGKSIVKIFAKHLIVDWTIIKRLITLSIGSIGQYIIATSSWIGLVRIMAVFGPDAIAGYTVGIRIIIFVLLPSWGLSNAASTLVGQNLGADRPDRAEKSVWFTGLANAVFLSLSGIVLIIFSEFWVSLVIDDPNVARYGSLCLEFVSYGFLFYGVGMVLISAFNGAGDTMTPTKINIFCYWLFEIPLAYYLALHTPLEEKGIYISILAAEIFMTIAAFIIFRKGKWKLKKV